MKTLSYATDIVPVTDDRGAVPGALVHAPDGRADWVIPPEGPEPSAWIGHDLLTPVAGVCWDSWLAVLALAAHEGAAGRGGELALEPEPEPEPEDELEDEPERQCGCACGCGCDEPATTTDDGGNPSCAECADYYLDDDGQPVCSREHTAEEPCPHCGQDIDWGGILIGRPGQANWREGTCGCPARWWREQDRGGTWVLSSGEDQS